MIVWEEGIQKWSHSMLRQVSDCVASRSSVQRLVTFTGVGVL